MPRANRKPWHRWLVGGLLLLQAAGETRNVLNAIGLGGGRMSAPATLGDGALDYYAGLAGWEHVVGGVYVGLLAATALGVMAWARWARLCIGGRALVHVAYFGWHLATSTYLAVFGVTGFIIASALVLLTLAYVFALVGRSS